MIETTVDREARLLGKLYALILAWPDLEPTTSPAMPGSEAGEVAEAPATDDERVAIVSPPMGESQRTDEDPSPE